MTQVEIGSTPFNAILRQPADSGESAHVARLLWLRALFPDTSLDAEEQVPFELLADKMTELLLPVGSTLYEEGSASDSLFFIMEGAVRHGTKGYTRFVPGDVLGFVDAMTDSPHRFTAVAELDTIILRLRLDDWMIFLEDHPILSRRLLRYNGPHFVPRPDLWGQNKELSLVANQLPPSDSASGSFVRRLLSTRASPLFRHAGIQALAQLVHHARFISLQNGDALHERDLGIWVVISGTMRIRGGHSFEFSEEHDFPAGTLLCGTVSLERFPHYFDARARTQVELMHIKPEDYFETMNDHFDLVRSALNYVALKIAELNRERLSDDGEPVM